MNKIIDLFDPDWWMNESNNALQMLDAVLFLLLAIPVAYLLIYAIASLRKYKNPYPESEVYNRFLVLYVVLKNGKEVIESINHLLRTQEYPSAKYDVVVAATQLPEDDLQILSQMPINIVVPDDENCSKIYAIQQVMELYSTQKYDAVLLLNSDNKLSPDALTKFNNAYYSGCEAIQSHRMSENLNTSIAVLGATSEEINNNLFRKGHTQLGFSSALMGSGVMFDFEMFRRMMPKLTGSDFTKVMELELLKENIYIEYLEDVTCYCKKAEDTAGYSKERESWIGSQYKSTFLGFAYFPVAFLQGKWDLSEKMFQWMMPSRMFLIAYIVICAVAMTLLNWPLCPKWYVLLVILILTFFMAIPEGEIARKFRRSIWSLPILIITSIFSHISRIFSKK